LAHGDPINTTAWLDDLRVRIYAAKDPCSFEATLLFGMMKIIMCRVDTETLPETMLLDRIELCDLSTVFYSLVDRVIVLSTLAANIPDLDLNPHSMVPIREVLTTLTTLRPDVPESKLLLLRTQLQANLKTSSATYGGVVKMMGRVWVFKSRGLDCGGQTPAFTTLSEQMIIPVQRFFNLARLNVEVHGALYLEVLTKE
jgi:hypothetical protein